MAKISASDEYMIPQKRAKAIIAEVKAVMQPWQTEARCLRIPQRDFDTFAPRVNKWLRQPND